MILVVENFNLMSVVHMHFVHSLLNGRSIYDEKKARFQQLSRYVVFVEASLPPCYNTDKGGTNGKKEKHAEFNIPTMLSDQLVPLFLQKSDKEDASIINGIIESISSDFSTDTKKVFPSVANFLCSWHGVMRQKVLKYIH